MRMFRKLLAAILAMTSAAASLPAVGQSPAIPTTLPPPPIVSFGQVPAAVAPRVGTHIQTVAEALDQDAGEYARQYGVTRSEAVRRLRAQLDSAAITDHLQMIHRSRLAGISIEHRPDYRIRILLTGTTPVPEMRVVAGGMTVPIRFVTGAKASREQVIWAITYHQAQIRALFPVGPAMGLDPRTGDLVIIASRRSVAASGAETLRARIAAITGVPVQIRVQDRTDVNLDDEKRTGSAIGDTGIDPGVIGGSRVEGPDPASGRRHLCTTGFVVTDGQRHGIVTAAHCVDDLTYLDPARNGTPMDYAGQWGWGYRDVQLHITDRAVRPLFYADAARTLARPVTGWRDRAATRAGDFVCHRGERTGYGCAEVELIDFAPAADLCAGPCLPTWVAVAGPVCKGGDSGGPVFSGTIAFGIVKGASYRPDGSCAFYFYMAIDYLPSGWSLLTSPSP